MITGDTDTILSINGRRVFSRSTSVTPKITCRMISSVRFRIRWCTLNGFPTGHFATSARASSSTIAAYPRSAAPENAGISCFRIRTWSSSSSSSNECEPMIGSSTVLPSPACITDGGLPNTSRMWSGRLRTTHTRLDGTRRIVNTSPYLSRIRGKNVLR